jgi:hypothetical protein
MMPPGEEKIVADRIFVVLSKPPKIHAPQTPSVEVTAGDKIQVSSVCGEEHGDRA